MFDCKVTDFFIWRFAVFKGELSASEDKVILFDKKKVLGKCLCLVNFPKIEKLYYKLIYNRL
jgi:hypothetical protein